MKKNVGLWIDHSKAVIITIKNEVVTTLEIKPHMKKRVRFLSGVQKNSATNDTHGSNNKSLQDQLFEDCLDDYYGMIISLIHDAESIWIFGPGKAKQELENHLRTAEFGARVVGIATVDQMTNPQIRSRVRELFQRT